MKSRLLFLLLLAGIALGWGQTQTNPASKAPAAYLRFVCAAEGDVPPPSFGEWPKFNPPITVNFEGGPGGIKTIASHLLPRSTAGYAALAPGKGKLTVRDLAPETSTLKPASPRVRASLDWQAEAGRFYTLILRQNKADLSLEILNDEPAVVPAPKGSEVAPPPKRGLRCLVLEPGVRVKVMSPEAGVKLELTPERPGLAENLKTGNWGLEIQGEKEGVPFVNSVELNLETPGNWTLFFMKNIYGKTGSYLLKDATLD